MKTSNFFDTLLSFGSTLKKEVDSCTTADERTAVMNSAITCVKQVLGGHPLLLGIIDNQQAELDILAANG